MEPKWGDRDSVLCACGWQRRIPNAFSCTPEEPAYYQEAASAHTAMTGHFNMSWPADSPADAEVLTERELEIGRAYRAGHRAGNQQAWLGIAKVFEDATRLLRER